MKRRIPSFLRYHLRGLSLDGPQSVDFTVNVPTIGNNESVTIPKRQLNLVFLKSLLVGIVLVGFLSFHSMNTLRGLEQGDQQQQEHGTIRKIGERDPRIKDPLSDTEKKIIAEKLQANYELFHNLEQQLKEMNLGENISRQGHQLYSSISSAREKTISKLQEQARMITQLQNTMLEQQNIVLELVKGTNTESLVLATPMPSEPVGSHLHILRNEDSQNQWNATGLPATSDLNIATNSSFGGSSNSDGVLVLASGDASTYNLELNGYKNAWDPLEESDSPVFWQISKVGVKPFKKILVECHRLVMSSKEGVSQGHENDKKLLVVTIDGSSDPGNIITKHPSYVNVDTTTLPGITKAKHFGLVSSGLADVIVIRDIFQADVLFDPMHRGRIFAMFCHPVERAFNYYNDKKQAAVTDPHYNAEISSMTLEQFANSPYMEHDLLTRYLSNQVEGPLSQVNLNQAMDILRRKVLVGLLDKRELSVARFEKFFNWKYRIQPEVQESCRKKYLGITTSLKSWRDDKVLPGTLSYELLASYNKFDVQLYNYIEILFEEQADFTKSYPDGYRLVDASCCVCDKTC